MKLNFKYVQDLDYAIEQNVIGTWSLMNGGAKTINDPLFQSLNWNFTNNLNEPQINELFDQPKIHGDDQKEYVLMPLCTFRNTQMEHCNLFQNYSSFGQTKCYTFNSNPSKEIKGGKVGPENGLRFITKLRIPSPFKDDGTKMINPLKMILHDPGTKPDIHFRTNTYIEIKPGKQYIIGTEATILEITKSFEDLEESKRNCTLKSDPQINCYFQALTNYGIQNCPPGKVRSS